MATDAGSRSDVSRGSRRAVGEDLGLLRPFRVEEGRRSADPETAGVVIALQLHALHAGRSIKVDETLIGSRADIRRVDRAEYDVVLDLAIEGRGLQAEAVSARQNVVETDIGADFVGCGRFGSQVLIGCIGDPDPFTRWSTRHECFQDCRRLVAFGIADIGTEPVHRLEFDGCRGQPGTVDAVDFECVFWIGLDGGRGAARYRRSRCIKG